MHSVLMQRRVRSTVLRAEAPRAPASAWGQAHSPGDTWAYPVMFAAEGTEGGPGDAKVALGARLPSRHAVTRSETPGGSDSTSSRPMVAVVRHGDPRRLLALPPGLLSACQAGPSRTPLPVPASEPRPQHFQATLLLSVPRPLRVPLTPFSPSRPPARSRKVAGPLSDLGAPTAHVTVWQERN